MTSNSYDVLLLGDYFFDMVYSGLNTMPVLGQETYSQDLFATGGAMYITAVALRRLGTTVAWASHFGDDYYSQYVRQLAEMEKLDLRFCRQLQQPYRRVTTALALHGERAFVTFTDPDEARMQDYWLETIKACSFKHVHLGGLVHPNNIQPLVEAVHGKGATLSMDCQDVPLLREAHIWQELVSTVDIFTPNAREAMLLTGKPDVESALRQLGDWCAGRIVVVKDGENGAWAMHEGKMYHVPALKAVQVVDTTGAGDCFNAGFLFAYLVEQQPIETCLRYGNICGGFSVQGMGGATTAPTHDALKTAFETYHR
ncbi:MAG: carbohydrate kinase family protein [Chloroflexi bacterium]|nr:carbohydrate kinase family protein [Chloroflexota bacterium]MCC6891366.1 carbohydrate kinase family protein [Anaerolineae bacterium]